MMGIMLKAAVSGSLLLGIAVGADSALPPEGFDQTGSPGPTAQESSTVNEESLCRRVADLQPRTSAGKPARIPSTLTPNGELLHWSAATGDTLRLTLFVTNPGAYTVSLFAVHGPNGAELSAKLWDDRFSREGETSFTLQRASGSEVLAVRFDPITLGPGRHILELSCLEAGDVLLDCIALRRTGKLIASKAGDDDGIRGRPFLGIQIGGAREGGVAITGTVPGSAAAEADLQAGDVIVRMDGEPTDTPDRLTDAILRHRPGDQLELTLLRGDEFVDKVVKLGLRSDDSGTGSRAAQVIKVLDVQPGQVIADIGFGSGWLSEAIGEALGDNGLVYAVEIQESHIRRLRRRSIPNVVPVFSRPDDVSLPVNSLDTAMLHDVASHIDRAGRPRFYASVARALKSQGRLVIFGPHRRARSMLDELRKYGFVPLDDEELAALAPDELDERLRNGLVFRYSSTASQ